MSAIAKIGNRAQAELCKSKVAKLALSVYIGEVVTSLVVIPGSKKSDILCVCSDSSKYLFQVKNGVGNNRGWSADRRPNAKVPVCERGQLLLNNMCLMRGLGERFEVIQDPALAANMIFGTDEEYKPTHFLHTVFNTKTWELLQLSICSAEDMYAALCKEAYPTLVAKRTCVHLSPRVYLQRKGGGKKDHSPDDIQLKIKSYPSEIMTKLETTLPPEEQVPELR
jgi:hypothetical protein